MTALPPPPPPTNQPPTAKPSRGPSWTIAIVIATAAAIVGVGIGYGAAGVDEPDEPEVTASSGRTAAELDDREAALQELGAELDARMADIEQREVAVGEVEEEIAANTIPGSGTYLVGSDIQPGQYRTMSDPENICYWERSSGTGGSFDEIIENGGGSGQLIVTIAPTDVAFTTSFCGDWTLIP